MKNTTNTKIKIENMMTIAKKSMMTRAVRRKKNPKTFLKIFSHQQLFQVLRPSNNNNNPK